MQISDLADHAASDSDNFPDKHMMCVPTAPLVLSITIPSRTVMSTVLPGNGQDWMNRHIRRSLQIVSLTHCDAEANAEDH